MTPLSSQDLEALKALAEKATGGDWACGRDPSHFDAPELVKADGAFYVGVKMEDAAFIAAFNPQTALALLADNERLKEHITALEAAAAEARRLALEEAEQAMHALKDKRSGADLSAQNAWSDGIAAIIALKERT